MNQRTFIYSMNEEPNHSIVLPLSFVNCQWPFSCEGGDKGVQHSIRVRAIYWRLMSAAHSNNNNNNSSDVGGVLGPKYEGPAFLFHSFTQWLVICSLNNSPPSPFSPYSMAEWMKFTEKIPQKIVVKENSLSDCWKDVFSFLWKYTRQKNLSVFIEI